MAHTDRRLQSRAPLLLGVLLLLSLPACGRDDAGLVVSPGTVDFGRAVYGDRETRTFTLRNEGTERVLVAAIKPSCSCITVGPFLHTMAPGQSTDVTVTFHTGLTTPGRLSHKQLDILSDDRRHGVLTLPLQGESIEMRRISPQQIDMSEVKWGEASHVSVRPGPGIQLRVLEARGVPEGVFDVAQTPAEGGVDVSVRIRADAGEKARGLAELILVTEASGQGFETRRFEDRVRIVGGW